MSSSRQPRGEGLSTSPHRLDDEVLRQTAERLAELFADLYGARPIDPRVLLAGNNMLGFVFQGGLTRADESHLEAGHLEQVRRFRERFAEAVADRLKRVVSSSTGARVAFFASAFDAESRTTNMLFVLDLFGHGESGPCLS